MRILAILMVMTLTSANRPGNWHEGDYCRTNESLLAIYSPMNMKTKNEKYNDPWFDRLVFVYMYGEHDLLLRKSPQIINEPSVAIHAVVIDKDRVLTALNPLRSPMSYKFKRHFTHVCYIRSINYEYYTNTIYYMIGSEQVACARPVVPVSEDQRPDMWQQLEYEPRAHLPLHDLVVMRTKAVFRTQDGGPYYNTSLFKTAEEFYYKFYEDRNNIRFRMGPVLTVLAKKSDKFGKYIKFGISGHSIKASNHYVKYRTLLHKYKTEEAVTDCDGWIPRSWGIFICLNNIRDLQQLPSGSMLYSGAKLFGVGCFLLTRESKGVLVFTDVRPYYDLIQNTCTVEDQDLKPPKEQYANSTFG